MQRLSCFFEHIKRFDGKETAAKGMRILYLLMSQLRFQNMQKSLVSASRCISQQI
jgi:hypothetical protein